MALDKLARHALLELVGELKLTVVTPPASEVATETLYQELMDAEAAAFVGAALFERTPPVTQRDGLVREL